MRTGEPAPEPLKIAAFRAYWLARLLRPSAQMAMVIVIGWQVYDIARQTMGLKEAAFQLGIIGARPVRASVRADPVTGWTADRIDRRWIARASIALELGLRGCARLAGLDRHDHAPRAFAVAALLGVARAFAGPALQALAPNLVPREILPRAIALSLDRLAGRRDRRPGVGGYLYAGRRIRPMRSRGPVRASRSSACS